MPASRDDPPPSEPEDLDDKGDGGFGQGPSWEPGPVWEPEPETTPWSVWELEREREGGGGRHREFPHAPRSRGGVERPPVPEGRVPREKGLGPAYVAVLAWLVVSLGMGLVTIGLHARINLAKSVLAVGSMVVVAGLALLAVAAWLVGKPRRN